MFYFDSMDMDKLIALAREIEKWETCKMCGCRAYMRDLCKKCRKVWNKPRKCWDGIEYE